MSEPTMPRGEVVSYLPMVYVRGMASTTISDESMSVWRAWVFSWSSMAWVISVSLGSVSDTVVDMERSERPDRPTNTPVMVCGAMAGLRSRRCSIRSMRTAVSSRFWTMP